MNIYLKNILGAEHLIKSGKLKKFLAIPFRYVFSFIYRQLVFKLTGLPLRIKAEIITGDLMHILFPSANDIYLFGCKSHDSELRLAKYLVLHIKQGDLFIDAGAHFGFYSILAARLAGPGGMVLAFEPSPATFDILKKNTNSFPDISVFNLAVYSDKQVLKFYTYPTLQSEYNTAKPIDHIAETAPAVTEIEAVSIDSVLESLPELPRRITVKIDVEGSEYDVLKGMTSTIARSKPVIVMEYFEKYPTSNYSDCLSLLKSLNYAAFLIDAAGNLLPATLNPRISDIIADSSDNLVFCNTN